MHKFMFVAAALFATTVMAVDGKLESDSKGWEAGALQEETSRAEDVMEYEAYPEDEAEENMEAEAEEEWGSAYSSEEYEEALDIDYDKQEQEEYMAQEDKDAE